jgi:hypothetical protein
MKAEHPFRESGNLCLAVNVELLFVVPELRFVAVKELRTISGEKGIGKGRHHLAGFEALDDGGSKAGALKVHANLLGLPHLLRSVTATVFPTPDSAAWWRDLVDERCELGERVSARSGGVGGVFALLYRPRHIK